MKKILKICGLVFGFPLAMWAQTPTFDPIAPICNGGSFTLPSTSKEGMTGTWSPAPNNISTTTYTFTPASTFAPKDFSSISAGYSHTVAIKTDGTLWAWGDNGLGQLGDGTTTDKNSPVKIGNATDWQSVSAGYTHTVAIKTDGTLWAWGHNSYGQLGDGTNTIKISPVKIGNATDWKLVSSGYIHTVAIKTDGTLWAWGSNYYGQLGDGTTTNTNSPNKIGTATNWKSVSSGFGHTVAIKSDGTLWAWGYNYLGQIGDGTNTNNISPLKIGTATNWKSISAKGQYTVATKTDGTLWAWGYNSNGQLGDGTTTNKNSPVKIGTATDWESVTAGNAHTVAIKVDGTLWVWGGNNYGQLGDGTTTNKISPVKIGTAINWKSISAGYEYTVAIMTDNSLWAWGDNTEGQLGDGTLTQKNTPVSVGLINSSLQVVINQPSTSSSTQTAQVSYEWNGSTYTQSGTYTKTGLVNAKGCDSTATLLLTISNASTWNGTSWSNGTPTSGITDVVLNNSYDCNIQGSFSANNILVKSGVILNTTDGMLMGIDLTLEDGASIIHSANELSLTGDITIKRNGTNSASTYNYWSSPVQSGSLASLGGNTYQYNETGRTATDYTSGWKAASGAMTVGKGYTATGTGVATFNGLLNSGNVSVPVTNTPIAGGTNDGWNLIGNPYPSELGIAEFFDANASLPNAVYYWNGGNYITANSGNIPLAQGFFVRALSSGTVQFTNGMRKGGATALYRTEAAESAIIPITSPSGSKDQTQIDINPKATLGFDALYDAAKLKGNTTLQLYSKIGADNFAINSLDASALGKTIYLGLDAVAGTYTIGKATAQLSGTDIYLNDKSSNKTVNLNTESYTFSTNAVSGSDRFSLTLGSIVTGVDALETVSGSTIYIQNKRLFVTNMPYGTSVSLINQEGKLILTGTTSTEGMDISNLSTGFYVAKASDMKTVATSKIIVQ